MNKMVPKKDPKCNKWKLFGHGNCMEIYGDCMETAWNKSGHNADTMWTQCGHRRVATGFGFIWGARGVATRMPMETSLGHLGAIIGKVKTVLPSRRKHHLCGHRAS